MKLTTRFRYGTRAMLDLAIHSSHKPTSLKEIAERQDLPLKYLENLFSTLQASGMVRSVRGPHGGYQLIQKPHEITLRKLYDVLEGSGPLADCTTDPSICNRYEYCVTQQVWDRLYQECMGYLDSLNLKTLMERVDGMQVTSSQYCI